MTDRERKRLEKLIFYVLGRRPDEFGLIPNEKGFFRLKDLHRALIEEEGTKNLRLKQLIDFFLIFRPEKFEFLEKEGLVRVRPDLAEEAVFEPRLVEVPPVILFAPVRLRAWIKASEIGLSGRDHVLLTSEEDLARRLAKRKGALVITVEARRALEMGVIFECYIEKLYLAPWLPAEVLKGPKVDEEFKKRYQKRPKEEKLEETKILIPPAPETSFRKLTRGKKKEPSWKRVRREKRRR